MNHSKLIRERAMAVGSLTEKELQKIPGASTIIDQAAALCESIDGAINKTTLSTAEVHRATADALMEIERARTNAVNKLTITVEVTPQVMSLMKQLFQTGLYGRSIPEIAERFISEKLISLLPVKFLKLKSKRSRSSVE